MKHVHLRCAQRSQYKNNRVDKICMQDQDNRVDKMYNRTKSILNSYKIIFKIHFPSNSTEAIH